MAAIKSVKKNHRAHQRRKLFENLEARVLFAAHTWTGAAGVTWSDPNNWTGGAPAVGEADCDLIFPSGPATLGNVNDLAGLTVRNITFTGNQYLLLGNAITIAGNISASSAGATNTISVAMTFANSITVSAGDSNTASNIVFGAINGDNTLTITKNGSGSLSLANGSFSGLISYSGPLVLSASLVFATLSGQANSTLTGVGTVNGINLTGGTINPGTTSPKSFVIGGGLNLSGSSTLNFDFASGSSFDSLDVTGGINLNGASLTGSLLNNYAPSNFASFTIIRNRTGSVTGTFNNLPEGAQLVIGGLPFTITYLGGTGGHDVVLTRSLASTSISVSPSTSATVFGEPITLTATLTGGVSPTGSIKFFSGSTLLGSGTISGGQATLQTNSLPGGSNSVTAVFTADAINAGSTSSAATVTVSPATLTLTLTGPATAGSGEAMTINIAAAISSPSTANIATTGALSIKIMDGATTLGTFPLDFTGQASGSVTVTGLGNHDLTAVYVGGTKFAAATSNTLSVSAINTPFYVVAADAPAKSLVKVFNSNGSTRFTLNAGFPTTFAGGIRVATGDIEGTGIPDIVIAPGPGVLATIKIFSGTTGLLIASLPNPYTATYKGGVFIAVGDIDDDGKADVIVSPQAGQNGLVKVYSFATLATPTLIGSFKGFPTLPTLASGVHVSAGDVDGDGIDDIVTSPNAAGVKMINVFSGATITTSPTIIKTFNPYTTTNVAATPIGYGKGFNVTLGDLNNDGKAEIIVAPGAGGLGLVKIFDGASLLSNPTVKPAALATLSPLGTKWANGVRLAVSDINSDGALDLIVAGGATSKTRIQVLQGINNPAVAFTTSLADFRLSTTLTGGAWVG